MRSITSADELRTYCLSLSPGYHSALLTAMDSDSWQYTMTQIIVPSTPTVSTVRLGGYYIQEDEKLVAYLNTSLATFLSYYNITGWVQ